MATLDPRQKSDFERDGFVVIPGFVSLEFVEVARSRFEGLFRGEFETGLQPDEWNWREGVGAPDHTRQICNGWKSDRAIARLVLSSEVGALCAQLMGWPGARINQDNVLWKPPGAKPLGFHQDDAYQNWIDPPSMVTCWMAMDDTSPEGGTIEYVPGSHRWPVSNQIRQFHAPDDYHEDLRKAAADLGIFNYDVERLKVKAGDAVFHHGRAWHGSGTNGSAKARRSVVSHCMSSDSQFHPGNVSSVYGRYKRFGSVDMDESFFPILWRSDGYRSAFIDKYLAGE